MKRLVIILCVLSLLVLPVLAVSPLTDLELSSAFHDYENHRHLYNGYWYDDNGYPLYPDEPVVSEIENGDSKADTTADESPEVSNNTAGETDVDSSPVDATIPDDSTLIHQEEASGNTQVNVFAIQTDDETGGTWIQGGSGVSLTEKLFGEYTPYNASGIASVDWAWIADVVLFAILVICFFKIVAGVMKRV